MKRNTTINFFLETEKKKMEKIMNIINLKEISPLCSEKSH